MLSKLENKYVLLIAYKTLSDSEVPNQTIRNYILENFDPHS